MSNEMDEHGWRPMFYAPRDGTRILLRMKHTGPMCAAWAAVGESGAWVWIVGPSLMHKEDETSGWQPLPKWVDRDE